MNQQLDYKLASKYHSNPQKIRILTEAWVKREIYCPACSSSLRKYENNKPVADFFCPRCEEEFELKSGKNKFNSKVVGGSYDKMVERISSANSPNFFFLNYNLQNNVTEFFVIPKRFVLTGVIQCRKPLSDKARRPNWTGCNILINKIPDAGKIFYIKNSELINRDIVMNLWSKTIFLKNQKNASKNWLIEIMSCIDELGKKEFDLNEVYTFEDRLKQKFPNNNFVKSKIRQQLQILNKNGYISFINNKGLYKLNL